MDKLRYSIIYAVIRPEISERISVGLITVDNENIDIRYSEKKLKALEHLYSRQEYEFVAKVVRGMSKRKTIKTTSDIEYLTRYSNNMINVSKLQTVDMEPDVKTKKWLYQCYVHSVK